MDAGNANASVPDFEVLAFTAHEGRILPSHNRRHFLRLHLSRTEDHAGIVACTVDQRFSELAKRIHGAVAAVGDTKIN
jgi:hypothetical protein